MLLINKNRLALSPSAFATRSPDIWNGIAVRSSQTKITQNGLGFEQSSRQPRRTGSSLLTTGNVPNNQNEITSALNSGRKPHTDCAHKRHECGLPISTLQLNSFRKSPAYEPEAESAVAH